MARKKKESTILGTLEVTPEVVVKKSSEEKPVMLNRIIGIGLSTEEVDKLDGAAINISLFDVDHKIKAKTSKLMIVNINLGAITADALNLLDVDQIHISKENIEVFKGCERVIERYNPKIFLNVKSKDIESWLQAKGFKNEGNLWTLS